MKKVFSFLLSTVMLAAVFTSCDKNDVEEERIETPKTEVPDSYVGKWMAGDFDMAGFWNHTATAQPDATEMVAYNIAKNGSAEQYIYYRFTDGSNKQTLTYRKGTVTFNPATNTLQFCPSEGTIRNFVGANKTEGRIAKDGLYPAYAPKYRETSIEPFNQSIFLVGINDQEQESIFEKVNF